MRLIRDAAEASADEVHVDGAATRRQAERLDEGVDESVEQAQYVGERVVAENQVAQVVAIDGLNEVDR